MELVNLELLKHPLNWITILVMLVFFAFFADVILGHYQQLKDSLNPNPVAKQ